MHRTSVMLPQSLKSKAARVAAKQGISLGELIRESLEHACGKAHKKKGDVFFADKRIYDKKAPADLSSHHDDYLY